MEPHSERNDLVKKRARANFLLTLLVGFLVVIVLAALVFIVLDLEQSQQQRNLIVSCTTPSGSCAKEGQKRTAEAVVQIDKQNQLRSAVTRQISIYAAYCSQVPPVPKNIQAFERCIQEQLNSGNTFIPQDKREAGK